MSILTIIFILIVYFDDQIDAKISSTCTNECLSKTYCLSFNGKHSCSEKVRVQITFKVIQKPGSYDLLHLQLSGHGIKSNEETTIESTLTSIQAPDKGQTIYTCYRSPLGATRSSVFQKDSNTTFFTGSSHYSDGILSCEWIFSQYDKSWPMLDTKSAKLVIDKFYQISLTYGSMDSVVAKDLSELPIYHMQFLKCCHLIFFHEKYLFTLRQVANKINYLLQIFVDKPLATSISLTNQHGDQLIFSCLYPTMAINANFISKQIKVKINDQLLEHYIGDSRCSWSTQSHLNCTSVSLSIPDEVYNLKIISGSEIVYSENEITLKNSSFHLFVQFLVIILVFFLGQTFNCWMFYFNYLT